MRILHTSDWHLGRTFHGRVLDDAQETFADHLVELARREAVDAVVVAGDVYDRAIPPTDSVRLLDDTLRRLSDITRVVLTPGNHDSAQRLGFGADLLREGLTIRARTTEVDRPVVIPDPDGGDGLYIYALPYLDPDAARESLPPLLAERLGETGDEPERDAGHARSSARSTEPDNAPDPDSPETRRPPRRLPRSHEAVVSGALRLVAADLTARRAAATMRVPALVMSHAFVVGGRPTAESERDIRVGGVDSVPAGVYTGLGGSPLAERSGGLDYVALGHLHRPQEIAQSAGPRLVYSGSPLPFSFDEAEDARNSATKSSVLLDLAADGVAGLERIPTPVLHRVRTLTGTMSQLLSSAFDDATGAWVRVVLRGERPPGALATLKKRFGSLLAFQHEAPARTARERIAVTAAADPLRITEDFFDDVCGRAPEPSERGVLRSAYESALASARSER